MKVKLTALTINVAFLTIVALTFGTPVIIISKICQFILTFFGNALKESLDNLNDEYKKHFGKDIITYQKM